MEESKTKNEFHSTLQHFRSIIKKEFENNDQDDIKRSLKVLHQDITTKVKSMKSKR